MVGTLNEKIFEPHGGSDPSAEKHAIDSIPKTEATSVQTCNVSDIATRGVDETRNKNELQTPLESVHSTYSPKTKIFLVLMTVFSTILSPLRLHISLLGLVVSAASPSVLIVRKWGPKWREERYQRLSEHELQDLRSPGFRWTEKVALN
ncbi:hypothetical protein BDZ45DRAFT_729840 [Acephala macrosclerotiorum]|nr:hypothetical protein BDZ45DRAFT_729840 [Acephala macrosclerotiorum]